MNNNVITFKGLYEAYCGCRRRKRRTQNAQRYEMRLLDNLYETLSALQNRSYSPHRSIRFVAQRPKAREIHAADFSDRVVHHWLVPRLERLFEPIFIHDVYSNRVGKGTHKAVDRLQRFITLRSQVHSVGNDGWFLQLDIANFFNSIDKPILFKLIQQRLRKAVKQQVGRGELLQTGRINSPLQPEEADTLLWLCHVLLKHDASHKAIYRGKPALLQRVPPHKQLGNAGKSKGLPIGNLTSQFFANVYFNPFDQFVKHQLKCRHYLRYVDDFILLADTPEQLVQWRAQIVAFLQDELQLTLKVLAEPSPVKSGADFLGYIVRPHYRLVRRRVVGNLREKLHDFQSKLVRGNVRSGYSVTLQTEVMAELQATLASYRGHFKHANSYRLRQQIAREFPWLNLIKDSQPSPLSMSYKRQQQFFRQRYPATDCHIQRGTEMDVLPPRISRVKKHQQPIQQQANPISRVVVREQGHLKNGLKRRMAYQLFIKPGVELCPNQRKKQR
ncbi:MAG: RNA-directed DNA polymerase [Methylococcales bacterium]|nr:RNA-directed DNA polymerase [Methylococcales bacterium]